MQQHSNAIFQALGSQGVHTVMELTEELEESLDHEAEALLFEIELFTQTSLAKAKHNELSAIKSISLTILTVFIISIFIAYIMTKVTLTELHLALKVSIKLKLTKESGKFNLDSVCFHLPNALTIAIEMLEQRAVEKGLSLK